jgi:cytochrome P450
MRLDPCDTHGSTEFDQIRHALDGFTSSRIFRDPELGLWLIAGHDNVRIALTEPQLFITATQLAPIRPLADAAAVWAGLDVPAPFTGTDPAQHTRIRALLREMFPSTPERAGQKWAATVTAHAEHLTATLTGTPVDLIRGVAARLPLLVILDVLGLPSDTPDSLSDWTNWLRQPTADGPAAAASPDRAHALRAMWRWYQTVVTARAALGKPGPGLIGELLRHRDGDNTRLNLDTIAALAFHLTVAGWHTTSSALAHAIDHAQADPHRWARIADDDHYLTTHVEESLRHTPALAGLLRVTTTDVTLDETTIPDGSRCLLLIGSANHDPRTYPGPHRFDPARARLSQHLSFGAGPHHCLGAALARLQLRTTLRVLARRLPYQRLAASHHRLAPDTRLLSHAGLAAVTVCPISHDPTTGGQP